MSCTDCGASYADCLTKNRIRVCDACLYSRVEQERDELQAMLDGALVHGIHTEESRLLADKLNLREGKHTAASVCLRACDDIAMLLQQRDEALEELEDLKALILEKLPYKYDDGEDDDANAEECVEYAAREIRVLMTGNNVVAALEERNVARSERDEARAEATRWRNDYIAVADALGMVGWAEGQGPAQVASVEDLVGHARKCASAYHQIDEFKEAVSMSCETPPKGCDCPGCSYTREKAANGEL